MSVVTAVLCMSPFESTVKVFVCHRSLLGLDWLLLDSLKVD